MTYRHMGILLVNLYKESWKRLKLQMVAMAFKKWKKTRRRRARRLNPGPTYAQVE